jgi:plastocyanin
VEVVSNRVRALAVSLVALAGLVALSAPVQAATPRAVAASPEVTLKAGINDPEDPNIAVLEFLPESIKVAKGTTVTWELAGPEAHSVTFVAPGTAVPPSADKDPSLFPPTPATGPYDGTTLVNSGVLPLPNATTVQKFSMSFGKTGSYTYYCALHPNMVGTVQVTDDTQDSQQKITKTGDSQTKKYLAEGEAAKTRLESAKPKQTKNPDGSTTYNVEMGISTAHTDVLAFSPTPREMKSGDHVTFVNNSSAPHTASFGGTLVPTIAIVPDVQNPVPGPSPQTLAQNVYLNTGWLPPKTKQGPALAARSYTYDVPAPGKYIYVCVLHVGSGMAGEIDAS